MIHDRFLRLVAIGPEAALLLSRAFAGNASVHSRKVANAVPGSWLADI
ncbi:MAG: hypothetical protein ACXVBE_11055 [Bdellovibrionota bacterium]